MKKLIVVLVAIMFVATAGAAMATGTNTLTVSASVASTCKFVSGTSTLNFGTLDPSVGTNVNASGSTTFWCTKGVTTDAIVADNGLYYSGSRQMKDTVSGDVIPYSLALTKDGNTNAGPGSPRTLTIGGTVAGIDYTSKSAGSYSDTVVLSITP
jgi:hypothetical protein